MTKKLLVAAAVLAIGAFGASAEGTAVSGRMLRMQPGEGVFTILDTSGVRPVAGSELAVRDMQDGETVVAAVANEAGRAVVELTEGRFILSVDKLNLSVLDVTPDAVHTECRIVMPAREMLVGGQAAEGAAAAGAGAAGAAGAGAAAAGTGAALGTTLMTPVIIGGAVVLVGGAAYAIDEQSGSSSSRDREPVVVTPPETIVRRPADVIVEQPAVVVEQPTPQPVSP